MNLEPKPIYWLKLNDDDETWWISDDVLKVNVEIYSILTKLEEVRASNEPSIIVDGSFLETPYLMMVESVDLDRHVVQLVKG